MNKEVSFLVFIRQTLAEHYKNGYLFVLLGFLSLAIFSIFIFGSKNR